MNQNIFNYFSLKNDIPFFLLLWKKYLEKDRGRRGARIIFACWIKNL